MTTKITEAPPMCQLHKACRGWCETERERQIGLCADCLIIHDQKWTNAKGDVMHFGYRNYRGEFAERRATPIRFHYGNTEHHPEQQWLMEAIDHDKTAIRFFALADMVFGSRPILPEVLGDLAEVQQRFPGVPRQAAERIIELEQMVADLVASGAGKVKEENDLIRLQAGGMQLELDEKNEALNKIRERCEWFIEDDRQMRVTSIEMVREIIDRVLPRKE